MPSSTRSFPTSGLVLDKTSIDPNALSREALMRELNLQKKPAWILRKFMNALETKRAAKGMGWSRPWNKYGLTVFRTHTLDRVDDHAFISLAKETIERTLASLPIEYKLFAFELWQDPKLSAFTFYHNNQDDSGEFEGLTLSFGRKVPYDATKRDRLDIILEDKRESGKVDGILNRVRIYINPWIEYQNKNYELIEFSTPDQHIPNRFQNLYQTSIELYDRWKSDSDRQWQHWSTSYIDYFGPRAFIPTGSSFL